ncbi:hypothetical protein QFC21_004323 [Naganishia friedmannii]|uniref:Uncharacterized protein n=1 Tax=Naganishia friedmannii TaxID=89922 RepID=A0ACC2VHV9_9TREE|nr:hypothetical protein QFC21_004323 [Naganishia friedmannii]
MSTTLLLHALGVVYFTAWSISFYPQLILNYKRRTASGLSQDFSILNPLGFLCYLIYTLALSFSPLIRSQYAARHSSHTPQVSPFDIAFSAHAFLLSSLCLAQTYWYSRTWYRSEPSGLKYQRIADEMLGVDTIRGDLGAWGVKENRGEREKTTAWTWLSLSGISVAFLAGLIAVWTGRWQWLDFIYLISYVKLYISIAKWLPQLLLNYRRQSTTGFSTSVILCDLVGSCTSLAELVLASFLAHDPGAIIGNPLKLGLGILTIVFDTVFVLQRYVLYPGAKKDVVAEDGDVGSEGGQRVPDEETPLLS